jgi:nucleoside-diphosphate-sugar epimerase
MDILITGGLGFIGANIVNTLGDEHTIDILDAYDNDYVGNKYIHRGSKGLQETNSIEKKHRELNKRYRDCLVLNKYRNLYKSWSFEELPDVNYDLIINCGALSEAILSQHFPEFTTQSIFDGISNIKKTYFRTDVLHLSSSMVYGTWEEQIDEQYSLGAVDHYGAMKTKAETICGKTDVVLRPIHVYGMGDGKFSIWMNIERQLAANKPFQIERAGCIYIDDFVLAVKNIIDKWNPGVYNISYDFTRNSQDIKKTYPIDFDIVEKLGPTGKPRGLLNSDKLVNTFNLDFIYKDYLSTIEDYYKKYEDFCKK